MPIQLGLKRKALSPIVKEHRQKANSAECEQNPENTAQKSQHHTFGKQLPDESRKAASARSKAYSHLAPTRGCPSQQKVRDVGAGDRQDEADHGKEQVKRL